jgi:tetratricopeptide (TPR) repeat protein
MDKLPKDIVRLIDNLCREGDRFAGIDQFDDAIEKYQAAWDLLPAPQIQWRAATWILVSVADAYFSLKDYAAAADLLLDGLDYPDGDANPFLYLRLGQCLLEIGRRDDAADALEEAFRRGGEALFEDEDPKYLTFVKTQLKIMSVAPTTGRFNRPIR